MAAPEKIAGREFPEVDRESLSDARFLLRPWPRRSRASRHHERISWSGQRIKPEPCKPEIIGVFRFVRRLRFIAVLQAQFT
jgi:hypothetical protein